jgi:Uncharacterized conserved protein
MKHKNFIFELSCAGMFLFTYSFVRSLLRPNIFGGGKEMKYLKAQSVLPQEILNLIQEYVDGEFLYIPRKDGQCKAWGEKKGTRDCLKERNSEIFNKYVNGSAVFDLMEEYHLSEPSIRRIIGEGKKVSIP